MLLVLPVRQVRAIMQAMCDETLVALLQSVFLADRLLAADVLSALPLTTVVRIASALSAAQVRAVLAVVTASVCQHYPWVRTPVAVFDGNTPAGCYAELESNVAEGSTHIDSRLAGGASSTFGGQRRTGAAGGTRG